MLTLSNSQHARNTQLQNRVNAAIAKSLCRVEIVAISASLLKRQSLQLHWMCQYPSPVIAILFCEFRGNIVPFFQNVLDIWHQRGKIAAIAILQFSALGHHTCMHVNPLWCWFFEIEKHSYGGSTALIWCDRPVKSPRVAGEKVDSACSICLYISRCDLHFGTAWPHSLVSEKNLVADSYLVQKRAQRGARRFGDPRNPEGVYRGKKCHPSPIVVSGCNPKTLRFVDRKGIRAAPCSSGAFAKYFLSFVRYRRSVFSTSPLQSKGLFQKSWQTSDSYNNSWKFAKALWNQLCVQRLQPKLRSDMLQRTRFVQLLVCSLFLKMSLSLSLWLSLSVSLGVIS